MELRLASDSVRRTGALVVALAVSFVALPRERAAAASGVKATIYQLASNNGVFESSDAPQWMLHADDGRAVPVTGEPRHVSETRLRIPAAVLGSESVSASSVSRASLLSSPLRGGKLVPNRRLAIVPFQWGGSVWTESDTKNTQDILGVLSPWWKQMSAGLETLNVTVAPALDANAGFGPVDSCRSRTSEMLTASSRHLEASGLGRSFDNVMVLFPAKAPSCGCDGSCPLDRGDHDGCARGHHDSCACDNHDGCARGHHDGCARDDHDGPHERCRCDDSGNRERQGVGAGLGRHRQGQVAGQQGGPAARGDSDPEARREGRCDRGDGQGRAACVQRCPAG